MGERFINIDVQIFGTSLDLSFRLLVCFIFPSRSVFLKSEVGDHVVVIQWSRVVGHASLRGQH